MPEELIGKVTHYFDKIGVAVIKVEKGTVAIGDKLHFLHGERDFQQTVDSLEVEKESVEKIKKGKEGGMKVDEEVKKGDEIYKVSE
ncbi:hypothetical protein KKF32_00575 [Patescibacteria group bacterium]|nr:hypothetical protein [Patescibacteria group bacterium]